MLQSKLRLNYIFHSSKVSQFENMFAEKVFHYSEYSMQLNASRIKVLQAQDDLVNSMNGAASKELLHVSDETKGYKRLLIDLIVQVI